MMIDFNLWKMSAGKVRLLSSLRESVLPRVGDVFVFDREVFKVIQVTHEYDKNRIDVVGERTP